MTDQQLHVLCLQYGDWCRTRRLLAPPLPSNVLARLQPRRSPGREPNAAMDARMPFLNMAVHALADSNSAEGMCFLLYYVHGYRPVKAMAAALGIGRRTFYDRLVRHARRVCTLADSIHRANTAGNAENSRSLEK